MLQLGGLDELKTSKEGQASYSSIANSFPVLYCAAPARCGDLKGCAAVQVFSTINTQASIKPAVDGYFPMMKIKEVN